MLSLLKPSFPRSSSFVNNFPSELTFNSDNTTSWKLLDSEAFEGLEVEDSFWKNHKKSEATSTSAQVMPDSNVRQKQVGMWKLNYLRRSDIRLDRTNFHCSWWAVYKWVASLLAEWQDRMQAPALDELVRCSSSSNSYNPHPLSYLWGKRGTIQSFS